ncbi:heme NO-binding domain-containing protein, partial [Acinetobacter baumannii]
MYGLVNRAIEQLVVATAGGPAWRPVCARAGVSPDGFIGMQAYPDDMTYRLVGAASEVLGHPPETVLRLFGEYWIV